MNPKKSFIEERNVNFFNCILIDSKLWFVSVEGYFMNIDINTKEAKYVELERIKGWTRHSVIDNMFENSKSIYWVDQQGNHLHEFNIELNKYNCYDFPNVDMIDWECFAGIYLNQGKLLFFPRNASYLIEFDILKKKYVLFPELAKVLKAVSNGKEDSVLWCSVRYNNWIYLFQKMGTKVIRFNLNNYQYDTIEFSDRLFDLNQVILYNNIFYILTSSGDVYSWDDKTEKCEQVFVSNNDKLSFSRIFVTEHNLFLLPALSSKILIVDLDTYADRELADYPNDLRFRDIDWGKYFGFYEDRQYAWFANVKANYMLRINKITENIEWIKIISPAIQQEWEIYKGMGKDILPERKKGLPFLFGIEDNVNSVEENTLLGSAIWEMIKTVK